MAALIAGEVLCESQKLSFVCVFLYHSGYLPPPPPNILGKKEEITEGRKATRASKPNPATQLSPPLPTPFAQGLDLPLYGNLNA